MGILKILFPFMSLRSFGRLLLLCLWGVGIAGGYGIIHDQVTYTLSPEYFTKFKFIQFSGVDPNMGDRIFAGVIGFLATYWIGLIFGWVMGRVTMKPPDHIVHLPLAIKALLVMVIVTFGFGLSGYLYATLTFDSVGESWEMWQQMYRIEDIASFYRVGTIHNMGYIGGIVGSIVALIWLQKKMAGLARAKKL